jgi:hypothetical protein
MMCSTTKIPHGQLELAPTVQATGKRVPLDEAMSVTMRKLALKQIKLLEANADGEGHSPEKPSAIKRAATSARKRYNDLMQRELKHSRKCMHAEHVHELDGKSPKHSS